MIFLTKTIFKNICNRSSLLYRPFYRFTAKDILKYTNNKQISVHEDTHCENILKIMNFHNIHNISIINNKHNIIGNIDYHTINDIVDFQNYFRDEFENDRYNLKRYGGN